MAEQQKIIIDNIDGITLTYKADLVEGETKRKIALNLELDEQQADQIQRLISLKARWSVALTVIAKQLPMTEKPDA